MNTQIVLCNHKYWEFVRQLRNNSDVKSGFLNQEYITERAHTTYMSDNWLDFWIYLENGEPIAYYGVVDDDIRFCVHPDHQGKGVGTDMLNHCKEHYPNAEAIVLKGNEASARAFEKAGFKAAHTVTIYRRDGEGN